MILVGAFISIKIKQFTMELNGEVDPVPILPMDGKFSMSMDICGNSVRPEEISSPLILVNKKHGNFKVQIIFAR